MRLKVFLFLWIMLLGLLLSSLLNDQLPLIHLSPLWIIVVKIPHTTKLYTTIEPTSIHSAVSPVKPCCLLSSTSINTCRSVRDSSALCTNGIKRLTFTASLSPAKNEPMNILEKDINNFMQTFSIKNGNSLFKLKVLLVDKN